LRAKHPGRRLLVDRQFARESDSEINSRALEVFARKEWTRVRQIGDDPDLIRDSERSTETQPEDSGQSLSEEITALLAERDALSWAELLTALTDDIESRLDETLQELQESNRIRYSGRADGYVLAEDES